MGKHLQVTGTPLTGNIPTYNGTATTWAVPSLGDKTYTQTFTSLATVTVPHNLGKYPAVTVIDSGGAECVGTVIHTNTNNLTITFSASFSGTVNCN